MTRWTKYLAAAVVVAGALPAPTLAAAHAAGTPQCHGHTATLVGTKGDDTLRGTSGRDVIVGLGGNDTLKGVRGNDVLCGGPGRDRLFAGAGNDRLDGGAGADVLGGGPGADRSIDNRNEMVWNPRADDYTGVPNTFVDGPGRDVIRGRSKAETDVLTFARSRHRLRLDWPKGTARTDALNRFRDVEVVIGTRHDDRMRGRDVPDRMYGGAGSDNLSGRGGSDELVGSARNAASAAKDRDVLRGGAGHDYLHSSDDTSGPRAPGVVFGGTGSDYIEASPATQRYQGGAGNDSLNFNHVGAVHVDAGRGAVRGKRIRASIAGFETYYVVEQQPKVSVVIGSARDEYIQTADGRVEGRGGDDNINGRIAAGGPGDDSVWANYAYGGFGDDELSSTKVARGGPGSDRIEAEGGEGFGGPGDDTLEPSFHTTVHGGPGDDKLMSTPWFVPGAGFDGGPDTDTADFSHYEYGPHGGPLTIDLTTGTADNTDQQIGLVDIESVRGSQYGDTIIGDDGDNRLDGRGGDDSADGRGGTDTCTAETVSNCEN